MSENNKAVVRRFYDEVWNRWNLAAADEILAPDIHFRGSLGTSHVGIDDFKRYVEQVRAAFPDWHNEIEELIAADEKVVARLSWSGTHLGELRGIAPAGRRVTYVGAGIFRLQNGKIADAWVVGDTGEFWAALGADR